MVDRNSKHHPWRPFPELKNTEILQIMEELRIPFSESDLLKPVPNQIQRVYELFVELYMGSQALQACQQSSQPTFSVIDMLEYPEIHLDAIQLMSFHRTVSTLMECVGIDDFTLKDIIKPETPRIRMILSGLINFAKFREEQLSLFETHSSKHDAALVQKKKLESQKQAALDRLSAIQSQRTKEEPLIQELEKTLSEMVSRLKDLKKEQSIITDQVNALKTTKEQIGDQLASHQFTLMTLKQDIAKLQNRIVQNPETLVQSLADLSEEIKHEKSIISTLDQSCRTCQQQLDHVNLAEQDLSKCIQVMEDCIKLIQSKSDLESTILNKREEQTKQEFIKEDTKAKLQQLERQRQSLVEKLDRLKEQQKSKRDTVNESLQSLREEYEAMCQERQSIQNKVDHNEVIVKETEVKVSIIVHQSHHLIIFIR